MDIGDVIIWRGRSWHVRGLDPHGVQPRHVYLEDVVSGHTQTVALDRLETDSGRSRRHLRLVDAEPADSS
jgi:hypothetical protein